MNSPKAKIGAFFQTLIPPWRFVNIAILLIAFFAPWMTGCSGPSLSSRTPPPEPEVWIGAEVLFWGLEIIYWGAVQPANPPPGRSPPNPEP